MLDRFLVQNPVKHHNKNKTCEKSPMNQALSFARPWWLVALLIVSGCKPTVEMQFDLARTGQGFYANGFPTDLRRQPDGHLDLHDFPRQHHGLTRLYVEAIQQDDIGYSTLQPVYLPFTGPLAAERLPTSPEAYLQPDAPIQLIDIDPDSPEVGRRFPLEVAVTARADVYRPAHLLQVLPVLGLNLRPDTQYALIATQALPVAASRALKQADALTRLLGDQSPALAEQSAWTLFAPLRDWLQQEGIATQGIVAATVWTTGDPSRPLFRAATQVARWPAPRPASLQKIEETPDYCVVAGRWNVPGFQVGMAPYAYPNYGGDILYDEDGAPYVQYFRDAPFVVTIPRQPMPTEGFPLLMYNHGTGGDSGQVYQRGKTLPNGEMEAGGGPARIAAQRGWAASGMGGHMALEHLGVLGTADGYMAYNFLNPRAMRSNFVQMVLERVLFRRLLNDLRIDPSLCADASLPQGETAIRFSPSMQAVMGQSLGSYTAGMLAAVDPDPLQGAILTGAGGSWIEFVFGPTDPVNLQWLVEGGALQLPLIQHLDLWHPVPMLAEMLMGVADNIHYAETLLRHPRKPAPNVLVIEGYQDHQVPENIQRPLLRALGVDLAGEEVGATAKETVFPAIALGGAQQLGYPVQGNRQVEGQGERTAVVVRYAPDPGTDLDGHYVTFQREEPKHQYGCFLQNLAEGKVPVVLEGSAEGGACL